MKNQSSLYRNVRRYLRGVKRKVKRYDAKAINKYFAQYQVRKLHIGSGGNTIKGWLNSDYLPLTPDILRLDATKTYPFEDNSFDYIYSEHMIEHVTYQDGLAMLKECFRVTREDGKARISTPDLKFLIELHTENKTELQKEYIEWSTDKWIKSAPYHHEAFVINNFVRDWGHLFIYDEDTLKKAMEEAGFTNITRYRVTESENDELKDLENEERMPKGFLQLESLILEGTKKGS